MNFHYRRANRFYRIANADRGVRVGRRIKNDAVKAEADFL